MTSVSISQLKINPAKAISASMDFPLSIKRRDKTQAYLVGKNLFEKMVSFIEDDIDRKAVEEADYKNSTSLEDVIAELGLE